MPRSKLVPATRAAIALDSNSAPREPHSRKHIPTQRNRERVAKATAIGIHPDSIADLLDISRSTLDRHYAYEMKIGLSQANEKVASALFDEATIGRGKDRVRAQEFWLKNKAGWRDQKGHELSGPNGGAIPSAIQIEFVAPTVLDDENENENE